MENQAFWPGTRSGKRLAMSARIARMPHSRGNGVDGKANADDPITIAPAIVVAPTYTSIGSAVDLLITVVKSYHYNTRGSLLLRFATSLAVA